LDIRQKWGNEKISEITVNQILGGMRGVKAIFYDTSKLNPYTVMNLLIKLNIFNVSYNFERESISEESRLLRFRGSYQLLVRISKKHFQRASYGFFMLILTPLSRSLRIFRKICKEEHMLEKIQ